MASRAFSIIDGLYGKELRARKKPGVLKRLWKRVTSLFEREDPYTLELVRTRERLITAKRLWIAGGVLLVLALFVMSIYYYNALVRMEQDVYKEQAKISSLLQQRRNISTNLARTVRDYALHEQAVFKHLVDMRAATQGFDEPPEVDARGEDGLPANPHLPPAEGAMAPVPAQSDAPADPAPADVAGVAAAGGQGMLGQLAAMIEGTGAGEQALRKRLSGVLALAEQYPDLKLSDNFRKFMDALVETEKSLCAERMTYSDVVNSYTTKLKVFPGNLFANIYGFEPVPYFEADRDAMSFRPVDY